MRSLASEHRDVTGIRALIEKREIMTDSMTAGEAAGLRESSIVNNTSEKKERTIRGQWLVLLSVSGESRSFGLWRD